MVTAVDSSVLFDVLGADPRFGPGSRQALRAALNRGALVVCPIVWAEVRARFPDHESMERAMADAGLQFDPFDEACSDLAGRLWGEYRRAGGSRERLAADFLIGAHAQLRGGRLLSRDRGFYRRYFAQLEILH